MPPRSPRLPGAGDVVAGKYRLERLLKQGGMGAVWVATHLGLDERVALKFMDPRRVSAPEARARFTREAKAAAQLRSSNIVQILDHGVDNEVPYIAMELLAGEDLGGRLRRAGKLSMSEAAALLDDVARALDRAHAAGIVHRDLKPENIFLAKDGDHEVPKILDFGIAMEIQADASDDSAATQEGVLLGTPYFMSPEQVRGRANIDHRSDLWSLGVILFRAITGIRPFGRGAAADVIVQICSDPIPRASVVAPDLPEEVDRFFEKALARDASRRFSSAREMAAAFGEIAKLAEAAERTSPGAHASRSSMSLGARKGPPPLPGSAPRGGAASLPAGGADGAAPGGDPTRASGVLRKGTSAIGRSLSATVESSSGKHRAPPTLRGSGAGAAISAEPAGSAADTQSMPPPVDLTTPPTPADLAATPTPKGSTTTTPPPRDVATIPPSHDVAEAVTAEMSVPPREESSARIAARAPDGARAQDAAAKAGRTSAAASASREGAAEGRARAAGDGEPRSLARRDRSRLWLALAAVVLAAAVVVVGFRDELFGSPVKDPGGATIVLTAGTVVLVSPGAPAPSAPTSSAPVTAAGATTADRGDGTVTASATAAAGSTAGSVATTTTTTTSASASAVKPSGGAGASKPPADPAPRPEPTPVDPKPAPAPQNKDDRDLGY